jgi:hypothetical protein
MPCAFAALAQPEESAPCSLARYNVALAQPLQPPLIRRRMRRRTHARLGEERHAAPVSHAPALVSDQRLRPCGREWLTPWRHAAVTRERSAATASDQRQRRAISGNGERSAMVDPLSHSSGLVARLAARVARLLPSEVGVAHAALHLRARAVLRDLRCAAAKPNPKSVVANRRAAQTQTNKPSAEPCNVHVSHSVQRTPVTAALLRACSSRRPDGTWEYTAGQR